MAKIRLDKYYSSPELAQYCVNKAKEIIGGENITEYLEPSAGSGVFLDYLIDKPYLAYDIEPEDLQNRIIAQDYLSLELEYKKGRLCIGNPPFGERNNLAWLFYNKACLECDYIAFILPISQLNNNASFSKFNLIYSEDLGLKQYSDRLINCCFNIYQNLKEKTKYKFKDITIKEVRKIRQQFLPKDFTYDFSICSWGSINKKPTYQGEYSHELYLKINNLQLKDRILQVLDNADWVKIYNMQRSPRLKQWQIYKYLKEQIPELE